jgi:asparagine synthase (glutamine-hydrolysing)
MTPFEVATGWLTGEDRGAVAERQRFGSLSPIQTLESLLEPAMAHTPCVIAFSGGRDSSAVLAVATRLALRWGLPAPVAATLRYPGDNDTQEDRWQEMAIRHIGVADWEKIAVDDGSDLLGPIATEGLRRHGLLWPPAHHTMAPLVRLAAGGFLVTGDGGDEVFGNHRLSPLVRLLKGRRPRSRAEAADTALALAPRSVRHMAYTRSLRTQMVRSWLRPGTQERFASLLAADQAAEPLWWYGSLRRLTRNRAWRLGFHNQDLLAAAEGAQMVRPLQDPLFLASLAHSAPPWGFPDRDTAMRRLFHSLLPDALLSRKTKALFNRVVFGEHSRAFVARWSGAGVPDDLVDTEILRRFWEAPIPHAMSFALLQSAWLATDGTSGRGVSRRLPRGAASAFESPGQAPVSKGVTSLS